MREWRDKAIILRMGLFGEAHLWMRMLCQNHGILTIFAFGGAKSRKRFCGCLDVFNSLDCRVKATRQNSFFNLQEASLLEGTRALRKNWQNMGMAANCLRFMEALPVGEDSSCQCYRTLENLRSSLEQFPKIHRLIPLFFRLRVATALGFAPDFQTCGDCGRFIGSSGHFMADEGRVFCNSCWDQKGMAAKKYSIHVPNASLEALDKAQKSEPQGWINSSLSSGEAGACARVIDAFVQYHLGIAWDNGFFRHV